MIEVDEAEYARGQKAIELLRVASDVVGTAKLLLELYKIDAATLERLARNVLEIVNGSTGVAGWHKNGDVALWSEFEDIELLSAHLNKADNNGQDTASSDNPNTGQQHGGTGGTGTVAPV